jgi:hypothetical protein
MDNPSTTTIVRDPADWSAPAAPWVEPDPSSYARPPKDYDPVAETLAAIDHALAKQGVPRGTAPGVVQAAYETLTDELDLGGDEPEPEGLMPTLTRLLLDDYELRVLAAAVWKGKAGPSRRNVLLAHKQAAHEANRHDGYGASQRWLSERSDRSLPTTNKANRWLLAERFVELVAQDERADDEAFRYRLVLDHPLLPAAEPNLNSQLRDALSALGLESEPSLNSHAEADSSSPLSRLTVKGWLVWGSDGLGHVAGEVWGALARIAPTTVADLAVETGRHPTTVRKALRRLERHGLAAHGGHQWTHLERDPDELVAELGAGPLREQRYKWRHQRYAADREGFAAHREDRAEREQERQERQLQRQQDRPAAPQPAPKRPRRRPPMTDQPKRSTPETDLVAAAETATAKQMAAAAGRRVQRMAPLPERLAVCQGPEQHEQWFTDATLGHLSCAACKAPFRWAA